MACKLPVLGLRTHREKVKSLYKRSLRNLRAYYSRIHGYRIAAVCLRDRFDQNKCVQDYMCAKQLLAEGEEELFLATHYNPIKFPKSVGGVAHERVVTPPDWVLDYWHPLEKAAYPEYFSRREQRKKEYLKLWDIIYGPKSKKPDDKDKKIQDDFQCF